MSLKRFVLCSDNAKPFWSDKLLCFQGPSSLCPGHSMLHWGTQSQKHRPMWLIQSHLPLPDLIYQENQLQIRVLWRAVPSRLGAWSPMPLGSADVDLYGVVPLPSNALLEPCNEMLAPQNATANANVHECQALHAREEWSCPGVGSWTWWSPEVPSNPCRSVLLLSCPSTVPCWPWAWGPHGDQCNWKKYKSPWGL